MTLASRLMGASPCPVSSEDAGSMRESSHSHSLPYLVSESLSLRDGVTVGTVRITVIPVSDKAMGIGHTQNHGLPLC